MTPAQLPTTDPALNQALQMMASAKPASSSSKERRKSKRYSYPANQSIAPYDRSGLPTKEQFRQVHCQDLSTTGISFHWPESPDFDYIVILLHNAGTPIYVTGRITSVRQDPDAPAQMLVGCQFTGRVNVR